MSYSFSVTAATKDEAGKKVDEQLSQVVAAQPIHELDRQIAQDATEASVGLLGDPGEGQQYSIYVCGSLGWQGVEADRVITSANVQVSAAILTKS